MSKKNDTVVIKTDNESAWGQKRMFPIDGEVTVGEDGEVEVSEECAELLVKGGVYYYSDEVNDANDDSGEESEEDESEEEEEESEEDEGGEEESEEEEDDIPETKMLSTKEVVDYFRETLEYTDLRKVVMKNKLNKEDEDRFKSIRSKRKLLAFLNDHMTDEIRRAVTDLNDSDKE